jgi:predicted MFS family arabinose efflux permease
MSSEQPPAQSSTLAESQHKSTHKQAIKSGRGYILAISILQLVVGLAFVAIYLVGGQSAKTRPVLAIAVTMTVLGIVYMGLWIWAKTAPFAAALIALIIYVTVLALDGVFAPQQIAQGIIVKILIIAGLSQAVKSGYALKRAAESQP